MKTKKMKNIKKTLLILSSFTLFNCVTTQNQTSNDGSSMEKAIKVNSVGQEYEIVKKNCPDCKMKSQGLTFNAKDKPFDVLTFVKPNGEEVNYYFDISKFYGNF
jgi:predicted RNA-binding protein associated with RNAse of E/G family